MSNSNNWTMTVLFKLFEYRLPTHSSHRESNRQFPHSSFKLLPQRYSEWYKTKRRILQSSVSNEENSDVWFGCPSNGKERGDFRTEPPLQEKGVYQ